MNAIKRMWRGIPFDLKLLALAMAGGALLFFLAGCAALDGFFGVHAPDAPPDPTPQPGPPPVQVAQGVATAIGGPIGLAISQILGLATTIYTGIRAIPAVQRARHAKYSSARAKPT